MPDRPAPTWTKATSAVSRFLSFGRGRHQPFQFFLLSFFVLYLYFPLLYMSRNPDTPCTHLMYVLSLCTPKVREMERDVKKARGTGKEKKKRKEVRMVQLQAQIRTPRIWVWVHVHVVRCGAGQDSNRNLQQREEDPKAL